MDYYAIGMTALPYTVYDWMSMDNMRNAANEEDQDQSDAVDFDSLNIDSLEGMQQFNMADLDDGGIEIPIDPSMMGNQDSE